MSSSKGKRRQLIALFDKHKGVCFYCDGQTWLGSEQAARVRLGLPPPGTPGVTKMLRASRATREHLVRIVDGGKTAGNLTLACNACNVRRHSATPEQHRADMQALVAAGLHPTNRPPHVEDPRAHMKAGRKATNALRAKREGSCEQAPT